MGGRAGTGADALAGGGSDSGVRAKSSLIAMGLAAGAAFGLGFGVGLFLAKRWRLFAEWLRSHTLGARRGDVQYGAFQQ